MSVIRLQGETEKRKGIYYQLDSNDSPIGVGGMGQVFKGVCVNERNGATRPVAIKFMFDDLPPHASIQLRNDNLVEMLGFIEIPERTPYGDVKMHYHVVSELLTGVSLSDLMEGKTTDRDGDSVAFAEKLLHLYKNDSEHFARTIVMNVLSGLMALHDAGYIHRDIDPSNIMVSSWENQSMLLLNWCWATFSTKTRRPISMPWASCCISASWDIRPLTVRVTKYWSTS